MRGQYNEIVTKKGALREKVLFDPALNSPARPEHFVRKREDYVILLEYLNDLTVIPDTGHFHACRAYVGYKHISGFGTYGDIMIRDRKMYVAPTPFALTNGTAGLATLIVPDDYAVPSDFVCVGEMTRTESNKLVIGYRFGLTDNAIESMAVDNPNAGIKHLFKAYRHRTQTDKPVTLR